MVHFVARAKEHRAIVPALINCRCCYLFYLLPTTDRVKHFFCEAILPCFYRDAPAKVHLAIQPALPFRPSLTLLHFVQSIAMTLHPGLPHYSRKVHWQHITPISIFLNCYIVAEQPIYFPLSYSRCYVFYCLLTIGSPAY